MINLLAIENYKPGELFDHIMDRMKLRTDSSLARFLGVGAPVICKMRRKSVQITPDMLIRMHDLTGESLDKLRDIAHIPKTHVTAKAEGKPVEGVQFVEDANV